MRILLILLMLNSQALASEPFSAAQRKSYARDVLDSLAQSNRQNLENLYNLVSLLSKNRCKSLFENLSLGCLHQEVERNCQAFKAREQKHCSLLSDLVLVNQINEKYFVDKDERVKLSESKDTYGVAYGRALQRKYALLVTEFELSGYKSCEKNDNGCLAENLNAYCMKNADRKNLSWQACMGPLMWFMGTTF